MLPAAGHPAADAGIGEGARRPWPSIKRGLVHSSAGPFVWSSASACCLPGGIEWDPVEDNPIAGDLPVFDREPFGREGTRHWRRVSVVHQQGCFAVSEGGDDISLGEDLQEGCPERSILLYPLDASRRCFAHDVVADVGHCPIKVFAGPGLVKGHGDGKGWAVVLGHDWLSFRVWILRLKWDDDCVSTSSHPYGHRTEPKLIGRPAIVPREAVAPLCHAPRCQRCRVPDRTLGGRARPT